MRHPVKVSLLITALLTISVPLLAHHGNAAYADNFTQLKQATVTKFNWANPHSLLFFDVKDPKGNVVHWVVETGSPSALELIGWSKTILQPGDAITVFIYPSKSGSPAGRLNKIVLADGTELHDTQLGGADGKSRYNPDADSKNQKPESRNHLDRIVERSTGPLNDSVLMIL